MNWRVSILWPDDEACYLGIVDTYDEASGKYYVRYDDEEGEWVDMQNVCNKWLRPNAEIEAEAARVQVRCLFVCVNF